MGAIIYHVATTVDGFIADSKGECPPALFLPEGDHIPDFLNQIKQYEIVLMGGKTYEYGFQFGIKPGEPGYRGIKHIVFSRSLDFESNNEVELVKDKSIEYIQNLKKDSSNKIWLCGGGQLAASLLDNELLDRLILKVNPTIGGAGIRLFGESKKNVRLELTDVNKYESGVILARYNIKY